MDLSAYYFGEYIVGQGNRTPTQLLGSLMLALVFPVILLWLSVFVSLGFNSSKMNKIIDQFQCSR
jgi:hypothetical protein